MKIGRFYLTLSLVLLSTALIPFSAVSKSSVYSITLSGFPPYYSPVSATVTVGQSIRWINDTASLHTITHDGCIRQGPCAFDSGPLSSNAVFSLYDLKPGVYPYRCRLHPIMRGTLRILYSKEEAQT